MMIRVKTTKEIRIFGGIGLVDYLIRSAFG